MIDWAHIKPIDIHVEPIGPAPNDGLPTGRIIGGTVAARNSIPYQAALIMDNSGFCGGSLISRQFVLTAAHCVDRASQTQIILGAHNRRALENTQVSHVSRNHIIHPSWIRALLRNDIALIRLPSAVTLSSAIQLIALAPANAGSYAGNQALLSGWGRTSDASQLGSDELRHVNLHVITNAVCRNSFGTNIQNQHICTSGAGIIGACNGDSGGPLVVDGVEVGVVSFGARECESGHPTVFARVSHYRSWISANSDA